MRTIRTRSVVQEHNKVRLNKMLPTVGTENSRTEQKRDMDWEQTLIGLSDSSTLSELLFQRRI